MAEATILAEDYEDRVFPLVDRAARRIEHPAVLRAFAGRIVEGPCLIVHLERPDPQGLDLPAAIRRLHLEIAHQTGLDPRLRSGPIGNSWLATWHTRELADRSDATTVDTERGDRG